MKINAIEVVGRKGGGFEFPTRVLLEHGDADALIGRNIIVVDDLPHDEGCKFCLTLAQRIQSRMGLPLKENHAAQ